MISPEVLPRRDLKRVLLDAAVALARTKGPEAVALREVTRQAGVVPNAAYRHFASRDDLMREVRLVALDALADTIERALADLDPDLMKRKAYARASLRAVGLAYFRFAEAEPGLFRTAFVLTTSAHAVDPLGQQGARHSPYALLGLALDRMVAADLLSQKRRAGAEILAWSAVHGYATLLGEGPLQPLDADRRAELAERLVEMVERGL